jgi:hypothetical protein
MVAVQVGTNHPTVTQLARIPALEDLHPAEALRPEAAKVVAQTVAQRLEDQLQGAQLLAAQLQAARLPEVRAVDRAAVAQAASISSTKTAIGGDSDARCNLTQFCLIKILSNFYLV